MIGVAPREGGWTWTDHELVLRDQVSNHNATTLQRLRERAYLAIIRAGRNLSPTQMDLFRRAEAFCEHLADIGTIAELAAFVLIKLLELGEGIGFWC